MSDVEIKILVAVVWVAVAAIGLFVIGLTGASLEDNIGPVIGWPIALAIGLAVGAVWSVVMGPVALGRWGRRLWKGA